MKVTIKFDDPCEYQRVVMGYHDDPEPMSASAIRARFNECLEKINEKAAHLLPLEPDFLYEYDIPNILLMLAVADIQVKQAYEVTYTAEHICTVYAYDEDSAKEAAYARLSNVSDVISAKAREVE